MGNKNETQCKQILAWLQQGKTITSLDALNLFGCMRLASRIHELRCDYGYDIKSLMVEDPITGKRYAKYWLNKPE